MVVSLINKYGILLLMAVCIVLSGCQQQKEETPFYYGTWDEGIAPGAMYGVKSSTVTFTKEVSKAMTGLLSSVSRPLLSAQKHAEKRERRNIDLGAKWPDKNDDKN